MKKIAIVAGGYSSEWEVSMRSAAGLSAFIRDTYEKYIVVIKDKDWKVVLGNDEYASIDKNDFSFINKGEKITFDFAYITIHGTPGENGILQGYFDLIGLKHSTCNTLASALTFDKYVCNQYLKGFGVNVSEAIRLQEGESVSSEEVTAKIGYPCFVKPTDGGSSFGVTKVKQESEVQDAIAAAFKEGRTVMIEAFIEGTEITCGMYKNKSNTIVFPITEVVTHNEFFDYNAKYNGQVEEITPARIPDSQRDEVQKITEKIYNIINANGIIRIDYIIGSSGKITLLEVNTIPGMTATSFIPQQIKAAGLDISDVMEDIIESNF